LGGGTDENKEKPYPARQLFGPGFEPGRLTTRPRRSVDILIEKCILIDMVLFIITAILFFIKI
jgi:hypothetical protein